MGGGIKVLPFSTMFLCSGVTSPGVDNNGVILLSVAASLILTDNFSSAPVYHSFLSWHSVECFPTGAQFGLVQVTLVKLKTYTIILREQSNGTDTEPEHISSLVYCPLLVKSLNELKIAEQMRIMMSWFGLSHFNLSPL